MVPRAARRWETCVEGVVLFSRTGANGDCNQRYLALRIAKATKAMAADAIFRASDLEAEHIVVYRAKNGQRVFAVSMPSPVPTLQTFALSPGGDRLAVLSQDQIAFYPLQMDH